MNIRNRLGGGRDSASISQGRSLRYATLFIILLGTVSHFAEMAYEGAKSISGSYLRTLGASAATVDLGALYDLSIPTMVVVSVGLQLLFIPMFLMFVRDGQR